MLCLTERDVSAAERNGPDVFADKRVLFGAFAEAGLQSAKRFSLGLGGINE